MTITIPVNDMIWKDALVNRIRRIFKKAKETVTAEVTLTKEQMYNVYREQEIKFRTEDAERHIQEDYDPAEFAEKYNITVEQATDPNSGCYLCEDVALVFLDNYDCNISENDQFWDAVDVAARHYS